jgi:hypothetical protein
MVVDKLEHRLPDAQALRQQHEARPVGRAPEFPVGHHLETNVLLQLDHAAHGFVLHAVELGFGNRRRGALLEGIAQALRAQQAADVVGAEGRPAGCLRH